MKWILLGVAVAACVVCGLLGLTAGINLNPTSTVRYVPNWGSMGDWVSGVGALLAVVSSFILVKRHEDQQQDRERERIVVEQWAAEGVCSIRLISLGVFPCTVKGVFLRKPGSHAVALQNVAPNDIKITMPLRLESRQDAHFGWRLQSSGRLVGAIASLKMDQIEALEIEIRSVTNVSSVPISAEVAAWLYKAAELHGVAIVETGES